MKNILTIAGSDSCGGAGIQADIKTFCAHGTYAMSVITAVTAQNTCGVTDVQDIDSKIVEAQLDAIFTDICVDAVKIGMLSDSKIIHVVAEKLKLYKPKIIVLDPVMISKSGYKLLKQESVGLLISKLLPLVTVVTPNIPEAETICDMKISNEDNAIKALYMIYSMGAKNVLLKGGHLDGEPVDRLYDGNKIYSFNSERINKKNTHGTGCTLSSAIAANLALGYDIQKAVELAKMYVLSGIKNSIELGHGVGPINHFYELYKKAGLNV